MLDKINQIEDIIRIYKEQGFNPFDYVEESESEEEDDE